MISGANVSQRPPTRIHAGAIELRNTLALHFGDDLPATLVFDHPSLSAIAKYLTGRTRTLLAPPPPAVLNSAGDAPTDMDVTAVCGTSTRYPKGITGDKALDCDQACIPWLPLHVLLICAVPQLLRAMQMWILSGSP